MELNKWKQAVKVHIPAIETSLKDGLQQAYSIQLKDTATGSNEDAEQQMQQADKVVRFAEKNFQSEIFLGFNEAWDAVLADQLPSGSAKHKNIADELILELSTNLMSMITGALEEIGIGIEIASISIIPDKKLSRSFNLRQYFRAHLHAEPVPEQTEEQKFPDLELWVAASHPNEEVIAEYLAKLSGNNPFTSDEYADIAVRFAKHGNIVHDRNTNTNYDAGISMKGQQVEFEDFGRSESVNNTREVRNIDMLKDVEMRVSVELGRREMPLGNILQLVKGSVIELEKLAGEPVEILVNGRKIAQGDVVVIDEHFGVCISNLLASQERIKELQ